MKSSWQASDGEKKGLERSSKKGGASPQSRVGMEPSSDGRRAAVAPVGALTPVVGVGLAGVSSGGHTALAPKPQGMERGPRDGDVRQDFTPSRGLFYLAIRDGFACVLIGELRRSSFWMYRV